MYKLSVIIPNYNDPRILRTIDSVKKQSYTNYELIVVDGLSSNKDVLEIYKNSEIDLLIIEKDEGLFDALNKGIKKATGEFIYLLGSDDYLSDSEVFKTVVEELSSDSALDGVCIGCEFVDSNDKVLRKWYPKEISSKRIKTGLYPPHFSLFLNKELYNLVGDFKYKETKNLASDSMWLLDLALLKDDIKISAINNKHLNMEYGGTSTGSFKNIIKQFMIMHRYAMRKKMSFKIFHSFIKSSSKIFQFVR